MLGPSIRVPGRSDAVAQIRMRSSTGGQGQVFWVTKESPGYSESKSTHFEVLGDGVYHTYNLSIGQNPEWTGTIRQLRLDPVNIGGVDIEIDFIRIGESTTQMAILASLHFILLVGRSTKAGKAPAGTLRGR
jgi:hypothetical protein